jgi:hypothetical protein
MPGEALLALLQKTGFQQVNLAGYTGMKSSAYTEGALIFAAKPGLSLSREAARPTPEPTAASPDPISPSQPGGS